MAHRIVFTMIIAGYMGLSACQSTEVSSPAADKTASEQAEKDNCLRPVRMSGFADIDNRHILISAPTRPHQFLVETRSSCQDLEWAQSVSFKTQSNLSCVDKFSKLYPISTSRSGTPSLGCYVKSVERVESLDAAKAIASERAEARKTASKKSEEK